MRGAWCQALFLPRPPVLWSGQPGFRVPCVPGAVGAGTGPSTGPTACALAGRRCSLRGWRRGVPGGGAFRRCEGRLVSGAVPPPAARPLERAARVPRPVCPGCGRCGRGDPALAPQRAPLRAGVARCGGGRRASPGEVPSTIVRGAWCQALSPPRPPVLWSGQPGCRVPCVPGAVGAGSGDPAPAPQRAPLRAGVARCGGGGRASPGGVLSNVARGAWCQALSLPRPPVLWSGQPGFRVPCVPGAVGAGVWTQHRPHSLRPCGPALLAVGVVEGRPRGGAFNHCEGRLVSGAVPSPAARPLERAARVPRPVCPGAVSAAVGTQHRPHSVRPCGPALLAVGVVEGRPRGGAFNHCEGRLVSGAVPPPAARPLERAARVPRPVCPGCGRCGRGDPAPAPQRAPLRAGVARCGGGGRASPGGVPSTIVKGAWCQALSLPRPPVLWSGQPGFRVPCVPGAVGAGVGTQHRPHSVRPCGLALLAVGVAEGRSPGGVLSTVARGAWCQALSLPRPPVLWSGQPGFRVPCVPGAVGAGVGTQHRPHSVRPCGPALLAVGVAEGRPRGGCLPPL